MKMYTLIEIEDSQLRDNMIIISLLSCIVNVLTKICIQYSYSFQDSNIIYSYIHGRKKNFLYSLTEKFDFRFSGAEFVGGATYVFSILPFFYSNHSDRCIGIFIRGCKVWYAVMLIIRQLYVVFEPDNGWRRIRFYVALQIHVVLQGLSESWPRGCDYGREFDLHVNVTPGTASNAVLSDAIIRSAILFSYERYL